jgi:signal transduction histidine kinase/DNA-binding response OmpR family regulator/CHASE3 domain sensor protein
MAQGHASLGRLFDASPVEHLYGDSTPCFPHARGCPVSVQKRATIFLLVLVCAVVVRNVGGAIIQRRADEAQARAQAAQLLQTHEKQFAIGLLNQETGERGFELTGQSQYLQPYDLGTGQVAAARPFLDSAVIDSATRAKLIDVEAAASAWQAFSGARLAAVAVSGPVPNPTTDIEGKRLFDVFRQSESSLSNSLDAIVKQQLAAAQSLSTANAVASIVGTAAILLLIAVLAWIVFRSMLHPVRQLILAANALSAGEPVTITSVNRSDEIGQLAKSLVAWEQATRERLELAQAMVDVGATTDLDDLVALGLRKTAAALSAAEIAVSLDSGLVFILNGGEHQRIDSPEGALLPAGSPAAEVLRTGQPLLGDLRDPSWANLIHDWAVRDDLGPVITIPLVSGGVVVGTLTAVRHSAGVAFGQPDLVRAQMIAAPLAAAVRVARLFEGLRNANSELLESNQHKSTFMTNMSHELRTPLTAILGFSEILRDDKTDRFDAATKHRFFEQIHTSGQHLLGLINDLLDLSKVEAGQMNLYPERINLADSVQTALSALEPLARTKGITIDSDSGPGLHLVADPTKLKQMLLNLMSNAIKFTPQGGRVSIRTRQVESWIEIAVTDTGIGIADADLNRLFREFQQLDAGHGRHQEGTGLGLALTKRFAELHGGEVKVQSVPGEGSTFTLRLPVSSVQASQAPIYEPLRIGPSDEHLPLILVVEDNAEAAEILARHLEAGGFRMKIARTGNEALSMARELNPAAITLDILLPEIDGWEVLRRLKADQLTWNIPVVVVSVSDNPSLGHALGATDYFVKPVDRDALLSRLHQYAFAPKAQPGEIRVLVVDDEVGHLDLLEALLEPEGFHVLKASGGKEGIDVARAQHPHLILLDLMMPEVTGFDVVEALRTDVSTRSIPIMVVTAKELTIDDKAALNGHVAAIFQRNSLAGPELIAWLRGFVAKEHAAA